MEKILDIKTKVDFHQAFRMQGVKLNGTEIMLVKDPEPNDTVPFISRKTVRVQHAVLLKNHAYVIAFSRNRMFAVIMTKNLKGKWERIKSIAYNNLALFNEGFDDFESAYRFLIKCLFKRNPQAFYLFYNQSLAQRSFDLNTMTLSKEVRTAGHSGTHKRATAHLWPLVNEITIDSEEQRFVLSITPDFHRDLINIRQEL